jgi:poly-beta-1,6-N-acetyl-D-glucosamine synthase
MRLVLQGHRVGFEPSARAVDERRFPPAQEFRRKARTLTGVLQLCAWLPAILLPWRNPIWVQFLFHKLLRLATPYLLLVSAVSLSVWVAGQLQQVSTGLAIGVIGGAIAAAALMTALSRPLRSALQMAVSLQAAVVRATVNGLRGEWDVWSR